MNYEDPIYKYRVAFNPETGVYIRTSILDEKGQQTDVEPFRGSFPHLLDVGIMGHCNHGLSGKCTQSGVECYQSGDQKSEPHMTFEHFKSLVDQCRGRTFQMALGGRGDPDQHPEFIKMIKYARENEIVPNFTTSGFGLDVNILADVKKYCGAVAVSDYNGNYTERAIQALLSYGIKTNIHFVLSNSSIDKAIYWIEKKKVPTGINRVIFLLHKPVGNGSIHNTLKFNDPKVKRFYSLFNAEENCQIAGFDTCTAPALIHYAPRIQKSAYDTCEGGRYSAYVTPDFKLLPCSFDTQQTFAVDLKIETVEDAFNSAIFDRYRMRFQSLDLPTKCHICSDLELCKGGCPLMKSIVICDAFEDSRNQMHGRRSL